MEGEMSQGVSDAVFELHGACVHSLRFSFGAPLDYPYARAQVSDDNPPPALFRRLQAVSPPPARKGAPWQTGMTLAGRPLDPAGPRDRLADARHQDGVAHLDVPKPETVVLDWWFDVPHNRRTVEFPGDWGTKPQSDWVAVSFDAFWPAERDSADVIIPLGDCDEHCPILR
jgi:hypothetical protein